MYTYMYKFMRNYVHQNCPLCLSFNRYSKQCNNSALPFAINKYLFKNLKLMIFQYINHHQPFVKIYICIHVYLTTSLFREQQYFDSKWQVPRCNSCPVITHGTVFNIKEKELTDWHVMLKQKLFESVRGCTRLSCTEI